MNTCEKDGPHTMGSNQMLTCTNACFMRHIGLSNSECLGHCDRHGQSGCSLIVNDVRFPLCGSISGSPCFHGSPSVSDCELGCNSYSEDVVVGYTHHPKTCVSGSNIASYDDLSIQECAVICNNDPLCVAFEYGVNHGGPVTAFDARTCVPQSSAALNCDGAHYNIDLYVKSQWESEANLYCSQGGIASLEKTSHQQCKHLCISDERCKSFLWRESGTCHTRSLETSETCHHHVQYTMYFKPSIEVSASSGRDAEMISYSNLAIGDDVFFDRDYTFTNIGQYESDCYYLKGSNDDKNTPAAFTQWTIHTNFDCIVYLDFWGGQDHADRGMQVYEVLGQNWDVSQRIGTEWSGGKGPGIVYESVFPSGKIELYGNNGGNRGTYYAFVCPFRHEFQEIKWQKGNCRGSEVWNTNDNKQWDCVHNVFGPQTRAECAQRCLDEPDCDSFDTEINPNDDTGTTKGTCCLFKAGASGNGSHHRYCYYPKQKLSFQLVGMGSCWNSNQEHPPYEYGSETSNDAHACFEACRDHERSCTGFDTRAGCLFYFDEEVTQSKMDLESESVSCYKMLTLESEGGI